MDLCILLAQTSYTSFSKDKLVLWWVHHVQCVQMQKWSFTSSFFPQLEHCCISDTEFNMLGVISFILWVLGQCRYLLPLWNITTKHDHSIYIITAVGLSYSHLDTVPVSGLLHQQSLASLQQWKCDGWTQFVYLSTSCSRELGLHTDDGHNEGM